VEEGRFRLDLYYRISVINLTVPPLRERNQDVLLLADCFLKRFAKMRGQGEIALSEEAREALMRYSWPGNVRELQNVIEQAVHLLEGNEVCPEHLPERIRDSRPDPAMTALDAPEMPTLVQAEKAVVLQAMRSCRGNISSAARCLGIGRTTLYRKLESHGIDPDSMRRTAT
jgi:two-component system response regulator HydG